MQLGLQAEFKFTRQTLIPVETGHDHVLIHVLNITKTICHSWYAHTELNKMAVA